MKEFISKNITVLILSTLLLVSVSYSIKTKTELDEFLIKKDIKGTYAMQNENINDSEYFVFVKDCFYRYKQFELLDEGAYENIYDNIFVLKRDNINEQIIFTNEKIYFFDRERNSISVYSKISNVPTFINIDIETK
ncbi:MAG: hypothetical protein AB2421_02895 [Thermotaleaceae bacterium]